jgi:hypothetical protein
MPEFWARVSENKEGMGCIWVHSILVWRNLSAVFWKKW